MKSIRLTLADVSKDAIGNLLSWLGEVYDLSFTADDPDFVLHSCFGRRALRFAGVRIAWLGENLQPDFNLSDYATGFGRISFGDRYLRVPLYRWYFRDYESLFEKTRILRPVDGAAELRRKTQFCTMVVSNPSRGRFFTDIVEAIAAYRSLASGGRWGNNIGGPVEDKLSFIGSGRFHLAFENSSTPGYVTEKILHAFVARTIPVYWGAPDVAADFNPEAFVNCHDCRSVQEVLTRIKTLDEDQSAYLRMLQAPCFVGGREPAWLSKDTILSWYRQILDQPRVEAYRRNRHFWGPRYEMELHDAFFRPHKQLLKNGLRRLRDLRRRGFRDSSTRIE